MLQALELVFPGHYQEASLGEEQPEIELTPYKMPGFQVAALPVGPKVAFYVTLKALQSVHAEIELKISLF